MRLKCHRLAFLLMLGLSVVQVRAQGSFARATAQDEAAIRAIVADLERSRPNPHVAADLDWENAFGIRYNNLAKRDAFYHAVVSPLQANDTSTTMEIKVRFVTPDAAVADAYWREVGQLDVQTHKPGPDRWGRTTYILTRKDEQWTEVLERVADLRLPYYKHYDALPAAAPLPAGTLEKLAGVYLLSADGSERTLAVEGDHLVYIGPKRRQLVIPVSATEFLMFQPDDLAEYRKLSVEHAPNGQDTVVMNDETGETLGTLRRKRATDAR